MFRLSLPSTPGPRRMLNLYLSQRLRHELRYRFVRNRKLDCCLTPRQTAFSVEQPAHVRQPSFDVALLDNSRNFLVCLSSVGKTEYLVQERADDF
jgi:hypothetical protein